AGQSGAGLLPPRCGHVNGLLPRRRTGDSRRRLRSTRAPGDRLRHYDQRARLPLAPTAAAGTKGAPRLDRQRQRGSGRQVLRRRDDQEPAPGLDDATGHAQHRTPGAVWVMKHYQRYEAASISSHLTQDVLLMAGAEDHYVPVHQLPDQIATLTHVRSLTARLFTRAEQAQNHCQTGNMGLAFYVILDWMESLGTIEGPAHS